MYMTMVCSYKVVVSVCEYEELYCQILREREREFSFLCHTEVFLTLEWNSSL